MSKKFQYDGKSRPSNKKYEAEKFSRDSKRKGGSIKKKTHKMPDGTIMKGAKHP